MIRKILSSLLFYCFLCLITILPVKALTKWNYEDWQVEGGYGYKSKVSTNITNLQGEKEEDGGMKVGPFNKASKDELSDGIKEEVYVGLSLNNYENGELFELSMAINKKEEQKEPEYLTEAVVMTQKSDQKFIITANWNTKTPIAIIDKDGVYTYRWEFKKENNKLKVKFTILDYGEELGATDFVELKVDDVSKATNLRYLWACNIKANYGIDIYTTLPEKVTNPNTGDISLPLLISSAIVGGLGLLYVRKKRV